MLATGPHVPSESMLWMGCEPWTPEREGRTSLSQPNPDRKTCPVCREEIGPDPIDRFTTVVAVCGRCHRSNYEGQLPGRVGPGRDGYDTDRADESHRTEEAVTPLARVVSTHATMTRKEKRAARHQSSLSLSP